MSVVTEKKIDTQKESIADIESKPSIKNLFQNKSYMLVFGGQLLNMIASMLANMAFSYLIYATTKNASLMASMGILGSLPTVLIITFAGVIVDRFDQRTLIFIALILRVFFFIGFLFVFLFMDQLVFTTITYIPLGNGVIQRVIDVNYIRFISPMYTLLFLNNVVFSFYSLTVTTYSKYIIEKKNLLVANSFNSSVNQIASVIGPILAGMIITVSYLYSFVISIGITSLGSLFCLFLMLKGKKPPKVEVEKTTFRNQIKRLYNDSKIGFNAIRSEPKVLYLTIVYSLFNFCTAAVNGVFSVVLQGEMALNATWYGAIIAVMSAIGVITSLIFLKLGKINKKLAVVNLVLIAETLGLFLFAFIRNPWIMLFVITIPFGFVNGGANIPSFTLRQEKITHEKLGRATSVSFLFCSLLNLIGTIIVTLIANSIEPMFIVLGGASSCLLLSIVSGYLFLSKGNLHSSDYEVEEKEEDKEVESSNIQLTAKETIKKGKPAISGLPTQP